MAVSVLCLFLGLPWVDEEKAGCFTLIVFLLSCGCKCSVTLPCSAVSWSVAFHGLTFY